MGKDVLETKTYTADVSATLENVLDKRKRRPKKPWRIVEGLPLPANPFFEKVFGPKQG
jgi:hypothetical protein